MNNGDQSQHAVKVEAQGETGGHATAVLRGRLDVRNMADCWRTLRRRLRPLRPKTLEVDVSELDLDGNAGIVLLRYLQEGGLTPGATVTLHGLSDKLQQILDTFTAEDLRDYRSHPPVKASVPEEIGSWVKGLWYDLREQISFIGSVSVATIVALFRPKQMRWGEIKHLVETAGANALPVVTIFSFLVGLVLALEATKPLAKFGAQIFVADMLGFASIRDTGPMVAAIMLAGRSGSAFAAELGTMKVNEELDALTTMGLDPVRFLVIQRIMAALILTPLVTLYSMLASIVGGMLMLRSLGFPPVMIYNEIVARVQVHDLAVGLSKSLVFGLIVGGIGCLRGLQTREGPRAVGAAATHAVVAGILLIILANTIFSAVDYFQQ